MRGFPALLRRGVGSFLGAPESYAAVAGFYLLVGWLFRDFVLSSRTSDLRGFWDQVEFLLVFVVPVFTMRVVSDELRTGSLDLLYVRGVTHLGLVLAKLGAASLVTLAVICVPAAGIVGVMAAMANLDAGTVAAQLVGLGAVAVVLAAVGIGASSLTTNQFAAAILSIVAGLFLWFADLAGGSGWVPRASSLRLHLIGFGVGEVRFGDLVFVAGLLGCCVAVAVASLRAHRA